MSCGKRLQLRDLNFLCQLYEHRYLSSSLITDLPLSPEDYTSQQVTNRRLRLMEEVCEYIESFYIPDINERIFRVTKKGLEDVVADEYGVELSDLRWSKGTKKPTGHIFMKHFLLTARFRIALERACRDSEIANLQGFIPEHIGSREESGNIKKYVEDCVEDVVLGKGKELSHAPDGVFSLENTIKGKTGLHFLEIDTGSERGLKRAEKPIYKFVLFYASYLHTGAFKRYDKDFDDDFRTFRVLIATSSFKRLQNIREAMQVVPDAFSQVKRNFYLTVFNADTPIRNANEWFFQPIWYNMNPGDNSKRALVNR